MPVHPFSALQTTTIDPDETAHTEPSHQDLHCLPFCFDFWVRPLFRTNGIDQIQSGKCLLQKHGDEGVKQVQQYHIYLMYSDTGLSKQCRPNEMLQNAASHQGLHCLPHIQQFLDTTSKLYLFKFYMVRLRWCVQILRVYMVRYSNNNLHSWNCWFLPLFHHQ